METLKYFLNQEDNHYKAISVGNIWNNNYIKYENNGDRNKNLSVEEELNEIKPYLKDIITGLQKSVTWKIQLANAINLIFSKDADAEQAIHSKSDTWK